MPSSSDRNTYLERTPVTYYRRVYAHLYISSAGHYLTLCTPGFSKTLDLGEAATQRALTFSPQPHLPEPLNSESIGVANIMRVMREESLSMSLSARFYKASAACCEMGTLLIQYRRPDEGGFWRRWAVQLESEAQSMNESEKRAEEAAEAEAQLAREFERELEREDEVVQRARLTSLVAMFE